MSGSDFNGEFAPADHVTAYRDLGLHISATQLFTIMFLMLGALLIADFAGQGLGRWKAQKDLEKKLKKSVDNIYKDISWHLDVALKSPGALRIDKVKLLTDTIELRLGHLLGTFAESKKAFDALEKACMEETAPAKKKIKIDLPTESHQVKVWEALLVFDRLWSDQRTIKDSLKVAQTDWLKKTNTVLQKNNTPTPPLSRPPAPSKPPQDQPPPSPPRPKKWKGGKKPGLA